MIFNNKNNNKLLIIKLSIFFIIFFNNNNSYNQKTENIFIVIHGTWVYSFSSLLFSSSEKSEIEKRWKNTENKIAEKNGLIDITNLNNNEDYLKREEGLIEYKKQNNKFYKNTRYYKYNWDGFLSENNRNKAAKILVKEITLIKEKFPNSKIYIIGYSHGGNVALNMIKYLPKNNNLIIDELVLLATPIGKKSELLAKKKRNDKYFFKKIFCLYSIHDTTQIKDFMFNFPFCQRFLKERTKNVFQINCKYGFYNQKDNNILLHYPDHQDFWLFEKKLLIKNKHYFYNPVIYYLPSIIDYSNNLNKETTSIEYTINIAKNPTY
jgi:hypothetical protein